MKTLVHKQTDVSINIFRWENDIVEASFFKDKPEVNDLLMSNTKGQANFLYLYKIVEILENRDTRVDNANFNPNKAFFKLKVEMVNDVNNGYELPEHYKHINCSRRDNY